MINNFQKPHRGPLQLVHRMQLIQFIYLLAVIVKLKLFMGL